MTQNHSSFRDLVNFVVRNGEMRNRLLFTAGIPILFKLASFIPLPGIDIVSAREFAESSFMQLSKFEYLSKVSVLMLGTAPFLSACLLIQFATAVIRPLRAASFGGEVGRELITRLTILIALILSLIQGLLIGQLLEQPNSFGGGVLVPSPGWGFRLMCMLTMTAATVLIYFAAQAIHRYGIGNGFALMTVLYVPFEFIFAVRKTIAEIQIKMVSIEGFIISGILGILFFVALLLMSKVKERIPLVKNGSDAGEIGVRLTMAGKMPFVLAGVMMMLPSVLSIYRNIPMLDQAYSVITKNGYAEKGLYVLFIFIFTRFYFLLVFDTKYVCSLIHRYGYQIKTAGGHESETKFLSVRLKKMQTGAGLFLTFVFLFPVFAISLAKPENSLILFIRDIGLLLLIGVALDFLAQIKFLKLKYDSGVGKWAVAYTAFDEIEADVKRIFLNGNEIPALIEPLRFSWGLPIRTMVDEYRLYVPGGKVEEARRVLER